MGETLSYTPEQHRLKELYPLYYLYVGALAAIELAPETEWRSAYTERLNEIETEIIQNGGSVSNNPS